MTSSTPSVFNPAAVSNTPTPHRARRRAPRNLRLTLPRVVRSEFVKLRSVRSTWMGLLLTIVIELGTTIPVVRALWTHGLEGDGKGVDLDLVSALRHPQLAGAPSVGWTLAVIAVIVVASLYGASEYTCSTAYSTYQAVPRRSYVVLAKTICLAVAVTISALLLQAVTMVAVQFTIGGSFSELFGADSHVIWITCVTTAISMAMVAIVTMLVATLTRSTVIPISVTVVLMYIINPLLQSLARSYSWLDKIQSWMLDRVQVALTIPFAPQNSQAGISAGEGLSAGSQALTGWWLVLATALWVVVPLVITLLSIEKRDVI